MKAQIYSPFVSAAKIPKGEHNLSRYPSIQTASFPIINTVKGKHRALRRNRIGHVELHLKEDRRSFHPYINIKVLNRGKEFPMKAMVDTGCGPNMIMTYKQADYSGYGTVRYRTSRDVLVGDNRSVSCTVRLMRVDINGEERNMDVLVLPATKDGTINRNDIVLTEDDIPVVGLSVFQNKCVIIDVRDDGELSLVNVLEGTPD